MGIVLVTVLSAIGICERCKVESGGVYFLLSYVLGSRLAAAVGLLYCFGQVNLNHFQPLKTKKNLKKTSLFFRLLNFYSLLSIQPFQMMENRSTSSDIRADGNFLG